MSSALPQDLDLERQVLGALLIRPDLIIPVSAILDKNDFFLESHRLVFDSILSLNIQGNPVDPIQVIQYLKDRSLLEKVGDGQSLLQMAESAMTPGNAPLISRRLKSLSVRRDLIRTADEIREEASQPQEDENQFLKKVADRFLRITNQSSSDGVASVKEMKGEFVDYIENLIKTKGGMKGIPTGFTELDNLTSGLKGGELLILAARPGMGKTTLAMNMASNMALRYNKHVLIFSLEMSRLELLLRLLCSEAQINNSDLKKGLIIKEKIQPVLNAIDRITASPMSIEDSGTVDIWDIITLTRKLAVDLEQKGESLGLVVVDYLQLVSDPEAKKFGRQNEVASVSRSLKQLARMVNAPVLAASQMNRSVEQRKGDSARPQLSDLRESGAIEQDADMVMFIHQDSFADPDSMEALENRGTAEVIIAKHRNGPTGSFRLAFRPELNRFDNRPQGDSYSS